MVIKASSGKTVDALIADLSSSDDVRRDAATARLTVIGARAAQRLLDLASDTGSPANSRVAAFRVLDAIGEPRALDPALVAIGDSEPTVAAAAINVARAFLHTARGLAALDRLSEIATDEQRPTAVRVASIHALATLHSATVLPLLTDLKGHADPAIAEAATPLTPQRAASRQAAPQTLVDSAERALPADATVLREAILTAGATTSVTVLQQIVERVRIREGAEADEARARWTATRGAAHAALAQRGSRLALYDLREAIESAKAPLAVEFMAALTAIGDVNCLEPVAAAYAKAAAGAPAQEDWWRRSLTDVFRAIVQREGITRRHAVAKRIEKRWPHLFDALTGL